MDAMISLRESVEEQTVEDVVDILICRLFGRNAGVDAELVELLNSYVFEVCLRILHYCHMTALPDPLYETVAAMTIDLLRSEGVSLKGAALSAALESVRLGDAQFGFGQSSSVSQSIMDGLLRNYACDLHVYRRMAT